MAEKMTMPKVGMLESDIQLVAWRKKEGNRVAKGEIVADLESDKSMTEMESYVSGTILKIIVQEGDRVPIGTVLAIVGEPDEDISALLAECGA